MKKPAHQWKYAFVFLSLGMACVLAASQHSLWWLQLLEINTGLAFGGVGLAYAFIGPRAFGKHPDGRLPLWSHAIFWPYFALNTFSLWLFHRAQRENAFDEIAPNLWLGCRLWTSDAKHFAQPIQSTLDLTSEFGEASFLRSQSYRCLPLLDTTAPTLEQLRVGVHWIETQRENGPVYVHCALGHGRSGLFVLAWLLHTRRAASMETGLEQLRAVRPGVGLHPGQLQVLREFVQELPRHQVK